MMTLHDQLRTSAPAYRGRGPGLTLNVNWLFWAERHESFFWWAFFLSRGLRGGFQPKHKNLCEHRCHLCLEPVLDRQRSRAPY